MVELLLHFNFKKSSYLSNSGNLDQTVSVFVTTWTMAQKAVRGKPESKLLHHLLNLIQERIRLNKYLIMKKINFSSAKTEKGFYGMKNFLECASFFLPKNPCYAVVASAVSQLWLQDR